MRARTSIKVLAAVPLVFLVSCGSNKTSSSLPSGDTGPKIVYTVNYPLAYFAERIAGGQAKVVFPAPTDGDPAFWQPDNKVLQAFQQADLILRNGATYAKWFEKASLPASRVVDTSLGFKDQYLKIEAAVTHSHGPEGEHSHAGTDFNTWVDPILAIQQARTVCEALCRLVPDHAEHFKTNMKALEEDLLELDSGFRALRESGSIPPFVASHPVYNYVARRYGWKLKSMVWEPEEMPSEDEWKKLSEILMTHAAKHMIWEGPPDEEIAAKLKKDHGLKSLVFEPCGNRPGSDDYLTVMKRNLKNLEPAFQGEQAP